MKVLIFDIWGTVVETGIERSPTKQIKYFLREKSDFSDFVLKFQNIFMTREYDSLRIAFEEVVREFDLNIPEFVYDKMIGTWNKNAILSKAYDETFEVLEDLSKDYKLVLLGNIDKFSYDQLQQKFELSKYFDKAYLSFETKKLKNDPKTFDHIAKDFKVKKEDLVMIGDSIPSDMDSAKEAGVKGILVDRRETREFEPKIKDLTQLKKELSDS